MPTTPHDLNEACSEHFTYRELIECGETWERLNSGGTETLDNVPRSEETFLALRTLSSTVLDPVVRRFGRVVLTYGFASPRLTRHIHGRIAPTLDQHAAHEVNRSGNPICARLGAAVDLLVPGVDSRDVARWIVSMTPFDRLYFYEADRALHVSAGPAHTRQVVHMRSMPSGRRVPRVMDITLM